MTFLIKKSHTKKAYPSRSNISDESQGNENGKLKSECKRILHGATPINGYNQKSVTK